MINKYESKNCWVLLKSEKEDADNFINLEDGYMVLCLITISGLNDAKQLFYIDIHKTISEFLNLKYVDANNNTWNFAMESYWFVKLKDDEIIEKDLLIQAIKKYNNFKDLTYKIKTF